MSSLVKTTKAMLDDLITSTQNSSPPYTLVMSKAAYIPFRVAFLRQKPSVYLLHSIWWNAGYKVNGFIPIESRM